MAGAEGPQWTTAVITTSTDTELIAASGAGTQIYVKRLIACVFVIASGSATARFELGSGGAAFASFDPEVAGQALMLQFAGDRARGISRGIPMGDNVALNLETATGTPGTYHVAVEYEVLGWS